MGFLGEYQNTQLLTHICRDGNYYKISTYQYGKSLAAEMQTTILIDNSDFSISFMAEKLLCKEKTYFLNLDFTVSVLGEVEVLG